MYELQNDKYYTDAIAFHNAGTIIQKSESRFQDSQLLSAPIIYLFRHSAELLIKGLIIRSATNLYEGDVNTVYFPPHKRKLTQMHSLKALLETYMYLGSEMLIPTLTDVEYNDLLTLVERIDACDPVSTFFRYPYNKNGLENSREFVTPITEELLSEVPCCIGAAIDHYGSENYLCWHGDSAVAWLEYELDELVSMLVQLYAGKDN